MLVVPSVYVEVVDISLARRSASKINVESEAKIGYCKSIKTIIGLCESGVLLIV